jgi:hypothetical protein
VQEGEGELATLAGSTDAMLDVGQDEMASRLAFQAAAVEAAHAFTLRVIEQAAANVEAEEASQTQVIMSQMVQNAFDTVVREAIVRDMVGNAFRTAVDAANTRAIVRRMVADAYDSAVAKALKTEKRLAIDHRCELEEFDLIVRCTVASAVVDAKAELRRERCNPDLQFVKAEVTTPWLLGTAITVRTYTTDLVAC